MREQNLSRLWVGGGKFGIFSFLFAIHNNVDDRSELSKHTKLFPSLMYTLKTTQDSLSFHERQTFLFSDILNLITFFSFSERFFSSLFIFYICIKRMCALSTSFIHFTDEQTKTFFFFPLLLIFRLIFH